ncbi:Rad2 nuclease [Mortierella polycephala]|uniref:Rad2 nuclease n=1 Tax=Mortierella polycephala TaxID=41804 RepID=A0A9P6U4Q7_9FUNG|nr:Rad2 nuclease [Mortierella polycephala]
MGIQGLLPLLKSIEKPVHLKDYAGQTLAIDGYVWLHKGAFACAQELCLGQVTQKYITYFMRKIDMFKFFGVKPYIVFDGGYLPSKASTEQDRFARREESKKQAMALLQAGKSKLAIDQFRRCVDVTPEMAFAVIQALEAAQVDFVVAPYEADAQLAYLEKHGLVDGIVTEDSDLIVFGCKKIIFKLDQYGAGIEIRHESLSMVRDVSFHEWTMTEIRHMCILAGCDYLPSLPGMGLKTAQRLLRRFKSFDKVVKYLRMENSNMKIQSDYEDAFRKADLTFLYARVFDPISKSMAHLNPVPEELKEFFKTEEYDFLGPALEDIVLQEIASGRLNPINKTPLIPISKQGASTGAKTFSLGKENRPIAYKSMSLTAPSAKSIQSYFTKPSPTPVSQTTQSMSGQTKRKLQDVETVDTINKNLHEGTSSIDISKSNSGPSMPAKGQSDVIVEARSRFFGFDHAASDNTAVVSNVESRSRAMREDSGIGLDEASLLYSSSKASPMPNEPSHVSESKEGTLLNNEISSRVVAAKPSCQESPPCMEYVENTAASKMAEAKVIQGWREKFSNTSGSTFGGTSGVSRAFQASSHSNVLATTASSALSLGQAHSAPRSLQPKRSKPLRDSRDIIRTIPGQPIYHLDTPRRTAVSNTRGLGANCLQPSLHKSTEPLSGGQSGCLSVSPEDKATPSMSSLDRFKYTPSAL